MPMGSIDEAMNDSNIRRYLTVDQALTDFADIIQHIKQNLSAINSPVIIIGGSYAGSKFYDLNILFDQLIYVTINV